jgi:hypothetical protein
LADFEARRYARRLPSNPDEALAAFESIEDFRECSFKKLQQQALGCITEVEQHEARA